MKFSVTVKTESGTYHYFAIGNSCAQIAMDTYDIFGCCAVTVVSL